MTAESLPIDPLLPEVADTLRSATGLVLTAPPGAGKTTRVPVALLRAGFAGQGEILVLEPRRLAARLAASRVAEELGEAVGETVGYTIRFETVAGPRTRIRFLTEGILGRRILTDPDLSGVAVVLLDEFHERHLSTDLALGFLRRLQMERDHPVKIVVMSATLDPGPVADYLGGVPSLSAEGVRYETSIEYEERPGSTPLHVRVAGAVTRAVGKEQDGHCLVFLPGAAEIRRAGAALESAAQAHGLRVLPLHGDMQASSQAEVVRPSRQRKIILSTNVAETSITIPDVACVIDSGLARIAAHSAWTGLPRLVVGKISRSSANQRAGRAGRTRAGTVLRLYTRGDYESRPEHDVPEIRRVDLAEALLAFHGAGIRDVARFPWFETPPAAAVQGAERLLEQLGALSPEGALTDTGREMLHFPVHPRLARLIVEGRRLGVPSEAALLAALLSERDIRLQSRMRFGDHSVRPARVSGSSDLLEMMDAFREAERSRLDDAAMRARSVDPSAVRAVGRCWKQYRRMAGRARAAGATPDDPEEALRIATLAAFPDRVAVRRAPGSRDLLLCTGTPAHLSPSSVVQQATLMVAAEVAQRSGSRGVLDTSAAHVHVASSIEPEWLAAMYPDAIVQVSEKVWNDDAGRVDSVSRTCYGQVVLEESVQPAPSGDETANVLAAAVLARGLSVFRDGDCLESLRVRLSLLSEHYPAERWPEAGEEEVRETVRRACDGRRSIADLASVSVAEILLLTLGSRERALLRNEAPDRVPLGAGRSVPIHYEKGKAPWIQSRLQDFFGMTATPAICGGRLPLTVHLLAPNGRPVQITQDLESFWTNHYPGIRRELSRRYPKHPWPAAEDLR